MLFIFNVVLFIFNVVLFVFNVVLFIFNVVPFIFPSATSDGVGRLWNRDKGEVIREYTGHQKAIVCLAFRDASVS